MTKLKKVIKAISILMLILVISILFDFLIFNRKQFTLKKEDKGIITIDNYTTNDLDDNKKSIEIKIDKKYINKLRIKYSAKDDIPIKIQYIGKDYYNKDKTNEVADTLDNETDELIYNIKDNVKKINIIYDNKYSFELKNISIDNTFKLNPLRIFFVFSILFLALTLFSFYKKGFKTDNLYKYFIIVASILGITFIIIQPSATYYSWDDQIHFEYMLELKGSTITWNVGEFSMIDPSSIGRGSIDSLEEQINQMDYLNKAKSSNYQTTGGRFITYNKIAYIPSAIGYYLCKFLKLPFVICFKVGKIFNLLAFVLIMGYAIKISKLGKRLLCVIGLLPINIFLATQYSYDPAVTSGITLSLVILMNWFVDKNSKVDFKSMLLFILALLYGCFTIAIYIPFILLFLFVPKDKFNNSKERILLKIGIIIIFLLVLYTFVSPTTLSAQTGDIRGGNTSVSSQLKLIFSHPIGYIRILKDTFIDDFFNKLFSNANGNLAYLGRISSNCGYLALLTLAFVGFTDTEEKHLKLHQRLLTIIAVLGIIVLIWTALYLSFTPVGLNTINGVQVRYFMPFIFPLFICIQSSNIKNKMSEKKYNMIVFCLMSITTLTIMYELVLKILCY